MTHSYDGDGLRAKKTENGVGTYFLRSSVLGGQVVAELVLASGWQWSRGYVYLGSQLLAVQQSGVNWVHEDPVTKSKRVTNSSGAVVSTIELDPWGANTGRSINSAFQPRRFTSYTNDVDGGDDAMMRRYGSSWSRFSQPDPYDGSYDLSDPQSFNRYAYVNNDPVNFVDPSGWNMCSAEFSYGDCGGDEEFWGGSGGGGGGGGGFGGSTAEYNLEYGGMPASVASALRIYNERVANAIGGNGFRTYEEIIRGLNFDIHYGYNSDGILWTSFNIGVNIGDPLHPYGFMGTLDQWPPEAPGNRNFGWPQPKGSGQPRVTGPGGEPIRNEPIRGVPGVRQPESPRVPGFDPESNIRPGVNPGFWVRVAIVARALGSFLWKGKVGARYIAEPSD